MTNRVYYDVGAFAYFFLTPEEETKGHRFSPRLRYKKSGPEKVSLTSPFVREEFLYRFFTEKGWSDFIEGGREERIKKLREISEYSAFFDYEEVDLEEVTRLFQRLVIEGIEDNIVKESQGEEKKLDMYDFLHLAYSSIVF